MKIIQLLFFFSISIATSYAQLYLGGNYNIDIYKPYTPETQEYIKINDQVFSSTYHFYLTQKILKKR